MIDLSHSFSLFCSLLLSFSLSFSLFLWLSTYLPTDESIYRSIYLSIDLSIDRSIYLCISLSLSSVYLTIYLSNYLSIYLFICKLENLAILRGFFILPSWQHQKRSTSARLPRFLKLKTKQFCETSSFFEVDHIKNKAILRDFLTNFKVDNITNGALLRDFFNFSTWQHQKQCNFCETSFKNGKLSAELTASYQCVLRFFQSTCRKYCACHEKVMPSHTKCCTCHAKSSQQTWRSDAPKC